ncbi:MAG TPA: sensor domain-containing protein [Mycobacteriales bacterium]|nr:sensor domain-containing protein [Mycobacteriales bacterium]
MRLLTVFGERRTWGALGYAFIGFPLGVAGFVFAVAGLAVSAGLSVTLIGVPLLGFVVTAAGIIGAGYRRLGRSLLGVEVEKPTVRRRPGLVGYVSERNGWRALLFLLLRFPLAVVDFVVATAFTAYSLGGTSYPIWWHFVHQRVNGRERHGFQFVGNTFADTPLRVLAVFAVGVVLLLAAPWAVRVVTGADRLLIQNLLGPTKASRRIQTLEQTRTMAVDDAAAALRRIERDLHDGAQSRLVSLAMSLGLAKEELDGETSEETLTRLRALIDSAHREAKDTIVDLRDLARGIHPPALDRGLRDALATLAARAALPTTLQIDLPERPSAAVESIVYFCAAELLTNAAKHSGARRASVDIRGVNGHLLVRVGDDGAGGAELGRDGGTGLIGLTDRIATVDGRLTIDSPDGGPTLVTIDIPLA